LRRLKPKPWVFDIQHIRNDFPILNQQVYNKPLVYLDNGATTQKPRAVIDTLQKSYAEENSSIHRGIHYLSEQMTNRYEAARETVRSFINAEKSRRSSSPAGPPVPSTQWPSPLVKNM
jgi:cysteine desulfurase/selenocysteine lyase